MSDITPREVIQLERKHLARKLAREHATIHAAIHNLADLPWDQRVAPLHNLATTVTGAAILAGKLAALTAIIEQETQP